MIEQLEYTYAPMTCARCGRISIPWVCGKCREEYDRAIDVLVFADDHHAIDPGEWTNTIMALPRGARDES